MSKIIVTSRYLKSGKRNHIGNYVKYIATREGVALSEKSSTASDNQSELIKKLTNDFPGAVKLPEYQKYISAPSAKTASDCISAMIDENLDLAADREIYMNYLGTRPGVVKLGTHGLFSETDEPVVLDKVAREIAEHTGTVWTHVVSLRRDDAERMGYNNLSAWKNLVKRHIGDIAEAQKIDLKNLRWYAAYHQKENNPHVHIVVYSENPKEGYLTKQGIEKIRSAFVNDIYRDEMMNLYQEQTKARDDLRAESKKIMQSLLNELQNQNCSDPLLESFLLKLSEQLKTAKGKKVYGYLQPQVKKTVDDIVAELAKNPTLKKMYDEWCRLEREKYLTYTSEPPQLTALENNKVFKPIKNAVIQAALGISVEEKAAGIISENQITVPNERESEPPVHNSSVSNAALGLLKAFGRLISEKHSDALRSPKLQTDRKLRTAIRQKKKALGLKESHEPELKNINL